MRLRLRFVCLRCNARPSESGKVVRLYKPFVFVAREPWPKKTPSFQHIQTFMLKEEQVASACTFAFSQLDCQLQHVFREGCHAWVAGARS